MALFDEPPETTVRVPIGEKRLEGDLVLSPESTGLVLFAHHSADSRFNVRNLYVAHTLHQHGFATLLIDLLTPREEAGDQATSLPGLEVEVLSRRLVVIADWLHDQPGLSSLPIGLFAEGEGAGAALVAAADRPHSIHAVVSRGGRPDLVRHALPRVTVPTLLIVGALDPIGLELNRHAIAKLRGPATLEVVAGASHMFEEPGVLSEVADLAADWFHGYLESDHPTLLDALMLGAVR